MERLEPGVPAYAFKQPDGGVVVLDFSAPDAFCDFAMTMKYADGERRVSVYHTGEAGLFVQILWCWVNACSPAEIASGIDWIRSETLALTGDRRPTDESEHGLEGDLQRIAAIATGRYPAEVSRHHAEGPTSVTVVPDPQGLRITAEGSEIAPVACWVTAADIQALVVGMIWRSFAHHGISLSRLNTATYLKALDTFESGIRARISK